MLVCPNCRAENDEDATVCRHCGDGLDATSSPMRRIDRPGDADEPLDLPPPRARSVWPLVITVLVVGLGALGWGLFSAVQPNPCAGKYSSVLFSYCTEVPEGWAATPDFEPGGNVDRYLLLGSDPAATDGGTDGADPGVIETDPTAPGGAETTVEVSALINPAVQTPEYVQQFRTAQEADGLSLGKLEGVMLDGEQAIGWDFTVKQGQPESTLHVRDVVLVRSDGAWQIRFVSTPEAYEEARIGFEELLASWRWNG